MVAGPDWTRARARSGVLESPSHQDQVFANPVPEPSSAALIMAAMLSLGFVQRRRSSRHG